MLEFSIIAWLWPYIQYQLPDSRTYIQYNIKIDDLDGSSTYFMVLGTSGIWMTELTLFHVLGFSLQPLGGRN